MSKVSRFEEIDEAVFLVRDENGRQLGYVSATGSLARGRSWYAEDGRGSGTFTASRLSAASWLREVVDATADRAESAMGEMENR